MLLALQNAMQRVQREAVLVEKQTNASQRQVMRVDFEASEPQLVMLTGSVLDDVD